MTEEEKKLLQEETNAADNKNSGVSVPDVTPGISANESGISDEAYMNAINQLQSAQKAMPSYAGTYDLQLNDIYDQIVNRDKFKYDMNADALYEQYKNHTTRNGKE